MRLLRRTHQPQHTVCGVEWHTDTWADGTKTITSSNGLEYVLIHDCGRHTGHTGPHRCRACHQQITSLGHLEAP